MRESDHGTPIAMALQKERRVERRLVAARSPLTRPGVALRHSTGSAPHQAVVRTGVERLAWPKTGSARRRRQCAGARRFRRPNQMTGPEIMASVHCAAQDLSGTLRLARNAALPAILLGHSSKKLLRGKDRAPRRS